MGKRFDLSRGPIYHEFYAVLENGVPGQTFPLAGQFASCLFWADSKAVTQELRLNGTSKYLNWLVGAFYSHVTENEDEYCENNMSAASQYFYGQYVPPGGPPFGPGFSPFETTGECRCWVLRAREEALGRRSMSSVGRIRAGRRQVHTRSSV